jgi:hypothetical protein
MRLKQTYLDAPDEYWELTEEQLEELTGGCGPGHIGDYLVPDKLYGVINIKPACRIHDYMYAVGTTEEDKKEADRIFLNNMKQIILWETAGWYDDPVRQEKVREECERQAKTYHMMVATFGGRSFWKGKREDIEMDVV